MKRRLGGVQLVGSWCVALALTVACGGEKSAPSGGVAGSSAFGTESPSGGVFGAGGFPASGGAASGGAASGGAAQTTGGAGGAATGGGAGGSVACMSTCTAGATRCADEYSEELCTDGNGDGCLEWSTPSPCSPFLESTCQNGLCCAVAEGSCTDTSQCCGSLLCRSGLCVDATGSGGAAGAAGAGGGAGNGGGAGAPAGTLCPPITSALITDFAFSAGQGTSEASFGDFSTNFSGTLYAYGPGLNSDVTGDNWRISGFVNDYSGLILSALNQNTPCMFDASAFAGISFSLKGSIPAGDTLTFQLGFAEDDVPSSWLNSHKANASDPDVLPNFGTCIPVTNQFDGTCASPSFALPASAFGSTPAKFTIRWTDFAGGKPVPAVDAAKITSISAFFTVPPGIGTSSVVAYPVDITFDDWSFVSP